MEKHKFFDKLIKKDYNNNLEEVLSKKIFQEEVKNLLLDILYKVEISYKDYETVKRNVLQKETYIENIINTIRDNCESINFLKATTDTMGRSIAVYKEKKQILCYPNSVKLLYAISKIQKFDDIIRTEPQVISEAMTDALNIGNNINKVEPLRDFNGYSWNISTIEIENYNYNIIYQNLIFLVGNTILEEWINKNDPMVDYMELFKAYIAKNYGVKIAKEIIESIKILSILIKIDISKTYKEELKKRKKYVEDKLIEMENKQQFIDNLSKEKRKITREIRNIDIILSDKEKLANEYIERNKKLPLEEKIFSKRILTQMIKKEREEKIKKLQEYTNIMDARNFLKYEKSLKYEIKYLKLIDTKNLKQRILGQIISLQKYILQALKEKIQRANTKEELIKILYELRYYNLIPVDTNKNISQIARLKQLIRDIECEAIKKAKELKMLNDVCKDDELNLNILTKVFELKIIKLEDIQIKITKTKENKYYAIFYDEKVEDSRIEIDTKGNKIKLNKKIKFLI